MKVRELAVPHALELTPEVHADDRGAFLEIYRDSVLVEAVGHPLDLKQANCSVSRRGALRGIHFADVPPGQAKYVTCVAGAGLDVVIDLRVGSPAFATYDVVRLDTADRRAVYVAEGLGHAFLALTDDATLLYLLSETYAPTRERAVHPHDPDLSIDWPRDLTPTLSPKDAAAPTLAAAQEAGLLPEYDACLARYAALAR